MMLLRGAVFVVGLSLTAAAQPTVTASDAWLTEPGADGTAAAYLSVQNPSMYDIYVVSATSDVAGNVELRDGDETVKEITVPSFGSLDLKPGGMFLRLSDLKRPFKAGERVTLSLMTDGGVTVAATAVVKAR